MPQLSLPREFPFDDLSLPYAIDWMHLTDIDQVMSIERASFSAPWPASAYRYELVQNDLSSYLVLWSRPASAGHRPKRWHTWRREPSLPVLGYGGFWSILDEGHISTIAIDPSWRGRGLGELILVALIDAAIVGGAGELTLEVRISNVVAQNLYQKYGFVQVGVRKRYYHDNNEDALIMTTPRVDATVFLVKYAVLKKNLRERLG